MKKFLATILTLVLVISLFAGCKGTKNAGESDSGDLGTYEIRISAANSENHPQTLGLYAMKEYVEAKTDGKVKVNVFSNGQLGSEETSLQQVQAGALEMCTASIAPITTFQKQFQVLDIPFLFNSYEEAWLVLDSSTGVALMDSFEEVGLKGLAWMENGFRHVTTSKKPVKTLEDFNGLKIRVMNAPMHLLNFQTLKSNPTPVPFSELYMAMSQNIVEGQENPLANIWDVNMFEVQKYVSLTGHIYDSMPLVTNLKWWNNLPAAYQVIIQQGASLAQNYSRFTNFEREELLKQKLVSKGMEVIEIDQKVKDEMKNATQTVVADAVRKEIGAEVVDNFLSSKEAVLADVTKGVQ